jgi:hypothetical protein
MAEEKKNRVHKPEEGMKTRGANKWRKHIPGLHSGRSRSLEHPKGKRRLVLYEKGVQELAPKSLRRKGKQLLSECSEEELKRANVS